MLLLHYLQNQGKITSRIDPQARAMPSGGVVRATLGYLYQEIHHAARRGIPPERVLNNITKATEDIDSLDVRGIGSDMDILVDSPGGKSRKIIKEVTRITESARKLEGIDENDTDVLKNTLFPKADVGDYTTHMNWVMNQGGSTLEFLAFDFKKGTFVEHEKHGDIVENFVRGTFDYITSIDASYVENPAEKAIRGMRPLLEIPFLEIKDETVFRRELDAISSGVAQGDIPDDAALEQFTKMMRNARFSGAHNRFHRGVSGSLEEKIKELASAVGKKIPEFANSTAVEERVLTPTISLIQNVDAMETPKNTFAFLKIFNSCLSNSKNSILDRLNCFSFYKLLYNNASDDMKQKLDTPKKLIEAMNETMETAIADSNMEIVDRLYIATIYKELAPGKKVVSALERKLREDMEATVNSNMALEDRINTRKGLQEIQPG